MRESLSIARSAQQSRDGAILFVDCAVRCTLFVLLYVLVLTTTGAASLVCVIGLGVIQVTLVATLFHECVHRNLGISSRSQDWIARLIAAPLALSLSWWRVKHVRLHHVHVGDIEQDPDIQFAAVARVKAYQEWRPQYRFQALYGPIACFLVSLNMLSPSELRRVDPTARHLPLKLLLEKYALFTMFWSPLAAIRGLFTAALVFVVFELTVGAFGSVVVQLQHNTTLSNRDSRLLPNTTWERQYRCTTDTRSATGLWWWLSGGTSRHVAHHLYPKLTYVQLPRATRLLRADAPDWPEHSSVWQALRSHVQLMRLLAKPGDATHAS